MMEFWPEHQGQSSLYAKFGTVPGRNCTHNYHDRHQAAHYPLYYGEQQDPGRESSYWPVPGSRTGGAPQDYANWTDPELSAATTSSHFPFVLERHTKQHPDLGEYQAHEARDREWTAAQRAAREYERGFLREGWQRRWEPCSPVRYNNREVSLKRSDSSYRELEAWAARYSHSLPRRRRIEAELRGASQGLMDSSRAPERDGRSGTDPRLAALQQARQCANIREPGVWDRGGRQQTLGYYPAQAPAPDTSHMLDIKEKTAYQRRMFSQPPGYIAPPPYTSPHKSPPVMHHCDMSWEQDGKRQTYWSQPTLRKQDVLAVDLQEKRRVEKEVFTKPDGNKTCAELDELKHREPELNILQVSSPNSVQNTHTQPECVPSLQQPQIIPAIQNIKTNERTSSKVIEGRKFRLNKKTGGLTIFCLVSRIADATETPSLPICISQSNIQSTEVSKGLGDVGDIHQAQKLADEVDFRSTTLTEQSNISDTGSLEAKQTESPTGVESEMLADNLSNKAETDVVSPEKTNSNDAMSASGKQVAQSVQPASVKYPLWRQPSFTSKVETESLSTALKANSEEAELDGPQDQEECDTVQPVDAEETSLDNEEDTQESEDNKAIDTTCVVVKMELIPSPRKEHVHYIGSNDDSPLDNQSSTVCPESKSLSSQDETLDTETNPFQVNEKPEIQLESDLGEKKAPDGGGDLSFPCIPSSSISEKETLEERAERILGIPLHDCITEDQPEDATPLLDPCVEKQDVEVEPSLITNVSDDAIEQLPVDTREEEVGRTEDVNDDAEDEARNQDDEEGAEPQEQVTCLSEEMETDSQLDTDAQMTQETEMAEDIFLEPTTNIGTTEQSQEEDDPSSEHPFECLDAATDSSDSCLSPHPNPAALSESNTEEGLDVLDTAENLVSPTEPSSPPDTPSLHLPSPLPPEASTSHTLHSPDLPPVDLTYQTADSISGIENQDEEGETSQLTQSEISDAFEDLADQKVAPQELLEYEQPDSAACVEESDTTDDLQVKDVGPPEDVGILQQQLECAQAEDAVCCVTEEPLQQEANDYPAELLETPVLEDDTTDSQTQELLDDGKEGDCSTEEQSQKQASEDTGLSVQTSEISTETATEVTVLQQQWDDGQELDSSCVKDSDMSGKQSPIDDNEDPVELLDQTISREDATDSQSQIECELLQNVEAKIEPSDSPSPLPSDSEVSQSPLDVLSPPECLSPLPALPKSETEPASIMETDLVTVDACVSETVPPPLQLNSCEEFLQFPSSSTSESDPSLVSSTSTPPLDGVEGVYLPDKEEPQYPKSLWDAVNRIRKHTAPDSENEEEEVSEQWDPESLGEEVSYPDMVLDMNSERRVFDEHKVSTESVDNVGQDRGHEEPSRHAEEDALSCSSVSSSGDTVIIAEEDNVEETPQDAAAESKTEGGEELPKAAGEQGRSGEVNDETRTKEVAEDKLDKADTEQLCLNEECTAERVEAMEMMEMDQKENEKEGLTSTDAVVSDEITE